LVDVVDAPSMIFGSKSVAGSLEVSYQLHSTRYALSPYSHRGAGKLREEEHGSNGR
jgi:hypothetical protein